MYGLLSGMRIVEAAAFIAGPSAALHLAQMGAEVIRIDPIGGGPDFRRWPVTSAGDSLYWEALNKGKKSVVLDLVSPEGRELATALITAPGGNAGLFVTNYPATGFLAHDRLAARRNDLVTLRVMGWGDGTNALDYTVNAALGLPMMTGPAELGDRPVNHVLPAWDLITGSYGAFALLAAERNRRATGMGGEIRLPLGDVAMAMLGHIGQIGEVATTGRDRERFGNDLFGAFGRDFTTSDGRRLMLLALTRRQWEHLVERLGLSAGIATIERETGADFTTDEGDRFRHRDRLNALVDAAVGALRFDELARRFAGSAVCWSAYGTLSAALDDPALIAGNPVFHPVRHPAGAAYPTPGAAATLPDHERQEARPAPRLGADTDSVLSEVLGLPAHAIAALHDRAIIAGSGTSQT